MFFLMHPTETLIPDGFTAVATDPTKFFNCSEVIILLSVTLSGSFIISIANTAGLILIAFTNGVIILLQKSVGSCIIFNIICFLAENNSWYFPTLDGSNPAGGEL